MPLYRDQATVSSLPVQANAIALGLAFFESLARPPAAAPPLHAAEGLASGATLFHPSELEGIS